MLLNLPQCIRQRPTPHPRPSTENHSAPDANTAKVEKPWISVSEGTGFSGVEAPVVAKKDCP